MLIFDLLSNLLFLDGCVGGELCPASSFTAIGAAFATQGYWAQAGILHLLNETSFEIVATFVYLLSGIAGIIGVALGSPPRAYVWYFIGPALYYFLVAQTTEVAGVRWVIASQENQVAEGAKNQAVVWRLAQQGLVNSYIAEENRWDDRQIPSDQTPSVTIPVSDAFLIFDNLISYHVEFLANWFGTFNMKGSSGGSTNLTAPPAGISRERWNVLSDLKWGLLQNITDARLKDGDLRGAYASFMGSECGDKLYDVLNKSAFLAATEAPGKESPRTVFQDTYLNAANNLTKVEIGTPDALYAYFKTHPADLNPIKRDLQNKGGLGQSINCKSYLWFLINAFKVEAAQIYDSISKGGLRGLDDKEEGKPFSETERGQLLQTLFYGWNIKDRNDAQVTDDKLVQYTINLIFVHLLRNETAIVPIGDGNANLSEEDEAKKFVNLHHRTHTGRTKFAEIYSWALMIPYIQGVLLYLLAMIYPFAAILMIVPGWHKAILTWGSFWIWVKFWDVGFALVKSMDRTIWAMLGNNSNMAIANKKVMELAEINKIEFKPAANNVDLRELVFTGDKDPQLPNVPSVQSSLEQFDRGLALAANLDLDLSNSYYIYILSALFFAVPGITGQLVLKGHAGLGNAFASIAGGFGEKASGAAGSGFVDKLDKYAQANHAAYMQQAQLKAYRQMGAAQTLLGADNTEAGLGAQKAMIDLAQREKQGGADLNAQRAKILSLNSEMFDTISSNLGKIPSLGGAMQGALRGFALYHGMEGNPKLKNKLEEVKKNPNATTLDKAKAIGDIFGGDINEKLGDLIPEQHRGTDANLFSAALGVGVAALTSGGSGGGNGGGNGGDFFGSLTKLGVGTANRTAYLKQAQAEAGSFTRSLQTTQIDLDQNALKHSSGRLGKMYEMNVANQLHRASRAFNNNVGRSLKAIGGGGDFKISGKSADMVGAAMYGMLGADAKREANYFGGAGFIQNQRRGVSQANFSRNFDGDMAGFRATETRFNQIVKDFHDINILQGTGAAIGEGVGAIGEVGRGVTGTPFFKNNVVPEEDKDKEKK
ncbi:MAG TPA: hypothetical protein PKD37_03310 [Oligoflexia bacterium]|nr:hypothetical protein [Oligoflexia bacterium]HMP26997.1 hypothetical protein [Oligoflexia bacterium]